MPRFNRPQPAGVSSVGLVGIGIVGWLAAGCNVFAYYDLPKSQTVATDAIAAATNQWPTNQAAAAQPTVNQAPTNPPATVQPAAGPPALSPWRQAAASAEFKGRSSHSSVVFTDPADNQEKIWVIGGESIRNRWENDVWASADGKSWRQITAAAPFTRREMHSSVVFTDPADNKAKIWVIAGRFAPGVRPGSGQAITGNKKNDVWASADGKNWRQITAAAPFVPRFGHGSVVFTDPADHKAKIWVIGGFTDSSQNDVWASADGQNWIEMTAATPAQTKFPARYFHGSVVMVDPADQTEKIWLIGGVDDSTKRNDVWASADGKIWQEMAAATPFETSDSYSSLVFNNKLWVIGRVSGIVSFQSSQNSIYWSDNGRHWTKKTFPVQFPTHYGYSSLLFKNKIWLIGGTTGSGPTNDVWYYE